MIEHKIVNDVYSILIDNKVVLTIKLDKSLDQVVITNYTNYDVFEGPIKLLTFNKDLPNDLIKRFKVIE